MFSMPYFLRVSLWQWKGFFIYVWTLGESYLNTIFWIFLSIFFCAEKVEWKSIFLWTSLPVIALATQKRFSKKVVRATRRNVGKYISSIFRINLSELFLPFWSFPCSLKSEPPPSLIELEESKLFLYKKLVSTTINNRKKGREGVFWTISTNSN